ncbi:hypothetical protein [Neisseria sp. 83E34]|uniref:hypothetical protein n=1 Tax=Neisseria sp. 83E34 TaxID=1692264 RepID=UPI0012E2B0CF|nr:hypothetical protein [Neisseria sp. 83E34]
MRGYAIHSARRLRLLRCLVAIIEEFICTKEFSMLIQQLHWWEKTVEYKFIAWSKLKFDAIPLDGNLEQAGDALFSNENNEFFLIEFKKKKDKKHIEKELIKFDDYNVALTKIKNHKFNRCHFVVYGGIFTNIETKEKLGFGLAFEHYIDFIASENKKILGSSYYDEYKFFEKYAIKSKDFFEYLKFFCSLKKGKDSYSSSRSPFANALAVTKDGIAVSLNELISTSPKLQMALNVPEPTIQPEKPTIERTIDGPSW